MDDVIEQKIKDISEQIIRKYAPHKIILFGSAAEGNWSKDSDLDFFIIKENVPNSGIERMWEIRNLIETDVAVDFIVCRPEEVSKRVKMGDPFIKLILTKGRVIYG